MNEETYDTVWDSTNDYSYADLVSFEDDNDAAAITDKITLYADDKLIWGVEPDGTSPENNGNKMFYGDANCDEEVNLADAVLIMQNMANPSKYKITEQGKLNGDVDENGDGLTPNDAFKIQQYVLGIISNLEPKA